VRGLIRRITVRSFLIVRTCYQYWNLDEGFLLEDSKAYLKLGLNFFYDALMVIAFFIAKRNVDLYEIYNFKMFIYSKGVKMREKQLRKEKNMMENEKIINRDKKEQLEEKMKHYRKFKHGIYKARMFYMRRVMYGFFVAAFAVFIIRISMEIPLRNKGGIGITTSVLILAVLVMLEAILISWIDIKYRFINKIKSFFSDEHMYLDVELVDQISKVLEAKADKIRKVSMKNCLTDRACKRFAAFFLYITITTMVSLPIITYYNLAHIDSFYVVKEEIQDYVVVMNQGENYILSKCKISGEDIKIDTNEIFITEKPIKMKKKKFKTIEKIE
jgi:hypothetical protein